MANKKEAVIFIIDSSPSMGLPYPSSSSSSFSGTAASPNNNADDDDNYAKRTRLSCAKEAVEGLITDLMLQSKTNEAGVIVLKTSETKHHLTSRSSKDDAEDKELFNLTELSELRRPAVDLLKSVRKIEVLGGLDDDSCHNRHGGFCDGIVLAANSMMERTWKKQYKRKILLFTDAAHEVQINENAIGIAVNTLREIDCPITVVGLDFQRSAMFETPAEADDEGDDEENHDAAHQAEDNTVEEEFEIESEEENEQNISDKKTLVKDENEKFLISLTKWTGGEVLAASSLHQLLQATAGRRIPRSVASKIDLTIAPNFEIPARMSLFTTKANIPTLKKEAVQVTKDSQSENEKIVYNALGEIMTTPITTETTHWDIDNTEREVTFDDRTTAFLYGSDHIPIGPLELEGLKIRSPPMITILGYISVDSMPISALFGPTRIISGHTSERACTAISALAKALLQLRQYGVCKFVGRKDSDPKMGILAPHVLQEDETNSGQEPCRHLLFIHIPFEGDYVNLAMLPLDPIEEDEKATTKSCDDLIDALMLPPNELSSRKIPNPSIRSFRKTVMNRAIDPKSRDIIPTRKNYIRNDPNKERKEPQNDTHDVMCTPSQILEDGKEALDQFRKVSSLRVVEDETSGTKGRRKYKKQFWSDAT